MSPTFRALLAACAALSVSAAPAAAATLKRVTVTGTPPVVSGTDVLYLRTTPGIRPANGAVVLRVAASGGRPKVAYERPAQTGAPVFLPSELRGGGPVVGFQAELGSYEGTISPGVPNLVPSDTQLFAGPATGALRRVPVDRGDVLCADVPPSPILRGVTSAGLVVEILCGQRGRVPARLMVLPFDPDADARQIGVIRRDESVGPVSTKGRYAAFVVRRAVDQPGDPRGELRVVDTRSARTVTSIVEPRYVPIGRPAVRRDGMVVATVEGGILEDRLVRARRGARGLKALPPTLRLASEPAFAGRRIVGIRVLNVGDRADRRAQLVTAGVRGRKIRVQDALRSIPRYRLDLVASSRAVAFAGPYRGRNGIWAAALDR